MEWEAKPLQQLCDVLTDGDWIESKDQSLEGIRLVQTGNIGEGVFKDRADKSRFISAQTFQRLKCTEIHPGDCLVSRLPDPVGRACIIPNVGQKMITGVDCSIIRFRKRDMEPEFFTYYSQSDIYLDQVAKLISGTTRDRISRSNLGLIPVPTPPEGERKRIVGKLDAAFAALGEAQGLVERNRANARELFESYLNGVFEGEGEGDGWVEKKLGELCSTITKGTTPTTHGYSYQPEGVNFIKVESVSEEHELLPDMFAHVTDECHAFLKRSQLQANDILFSIAGALGRVAMVKGEHLPANTNQALAIFRLNEAAPVLHEYLVWLLSSELIIQQTAGMAGGAAQQNLSLAQMKDLDIAFPSKAVQKDIVNSISLMAVETSRLETTYQQKLAELAGLKKGLLGAAFRGEL